MLSTKLKEAAGNSADATLYVDDVFSTYLYTGNGSTQTITNGIDLAGKGGMVWIKSRSAATDHKLTDTVRGVTKALISDTTGAQTTDANGLTAFSSTGFSLGTDSVYNTNAATYASWTFRKAAKFFDVVTYTGTGSARTIAHSLGVAPGMVIVKRTDTSANWQVYSNGLTSAANSIQLNSTAAQASAPTVWNSTAPTSSVFSVGTDATVNASGGTYVAYLFAHDTDADGIIQCGSFTTDGSGNASVNLGWEPQYILFRAVSNGQNWRIGDTMRGWVANSTSNMELGLRANSSGAENGYLDTATQITATGFNATSITASDTYIYMAIRRPNKPPTTGTQVYNAIARTGTGANVSVTGAGFTPDWVFSFDKGAYAAGCGWFDRLRGPLRLINTTDGLTAESSATNSLTSFNMDGYSAGSDPSSTLNTASEPYINWLMKRAPGVFDEVCETSTQNANKRILHNLTVPPELIIVRKRTSGGVSWYVYSQSLGINYRLYIYLGNAAQSVANFWGTSIPTATDFGIDEATAFISGQTYVAYLFATLAGISKVGSYTGNGTGQAIACGFSGGARFVLIKRTDSTGGWYTFDSARGLTSGSSPYLLLNSTAAEVTGNNGVYASSGGFTLGATAITTTNIATATYIFLAVA
jgi:hypothetical protein